MRADKQNVRAANKNYRCQVQIEIPVAKHQQLVSGKYFYIVLTVCCMYCVEGRPQPADI